MPGGGRLAFPRRAAEQLKMDEDAGWLGRTTRSQVLSWQRRKVEPLMAGRRLTLATLTDRPVRSLSCWESSVYVDRFDVRTW